MEMRLEFLTTSLSEKSLCKKYKIEKMLISLQKWKAING